MAAALNLRGQARRCGRLSEDVHAEHLVESNRLQVSSTAGDDGTRGWQDNVPAADWCRRAGSIPCFTLARNLRRVPRVFLARAVV